MKQNQKTIMINGTGNKNWIGGLYYKKNILFSLVQNAYIMKNYRIIVLTDEENKKVFDNCFSDIDVITICNNNKYKAKVMKLLITLKYSVKYIFPTKQSKLLNFFGITCVEWIPDFQHCVYPQFFTIEEKNVRDIKFKKIAKERNPLILSSQSAQDDFNNYFGGRDNVYVFPFVSFIEKEIKELNVDFEESTLKKFGLNDTDYICISNQFWQHKNHLVIINAIKQLVNKYGYLNYKFVFTGAVVENKGNSYSKQLLSLLNETSVKENTVLLGFLDRKEQIVLMKSSKFIIQPSLFEGWGTVLEDAKVLNKLILLSDIKVHREQKNKNCYLFNPNDPQELAELILSVLKVQHSDDLTTGLTEMYENARIYSKEFEKLLNQN